MPRVLLLLLRLRLKGWVRRLFRGLGSVRGVLSIVFVVLLLMGFLVPSLFHEGASPDVVQRTRTYGPLGLIAICILQLMFSGAEGGLTFTPAEVDLLFPAPLSRRQLLAYKVAGSLAVGFFTAMFLGVAMRSYTAMWLAAFLGTFVIFSFVQLFSMALALVASAVGARAFTLQRRIFLAVMVVGSIALAVQAGGNPLEDGLPELADKIRNSPAGRFVLAPVLWLFETFTAEQVWPDLLAAFGRSLIVLAALLGLIFILDAEYLEASAAASERLYAKLERIRRGQGTAAFQPSGYLGMPPLPRWGGVGTIAWRQMTALLRNWKSMVFFVLMFVPMMLVIGQSRPERETSLSPFAVASPLLFFLLFMGPSSLRYDFRADIDRMESLKSLPLSPFPLALGQVLVPVLVLTLVSWAIVGFLAFRSENQAMMAVAVCMLPANFLMVGLENLLFLWFPTRMAPAAPGDFRYMGRHMMIGFARMFLFFLLLIPAVLAGTLVTMVAGGQWIAGLAVAWVIAMLTGLGVVAVVADAFRRFDVAQDIG